MSRRMSARLCAALLLALAACARPAPESFRREGEMISSVALFDAARWSGPWEVVAATTPGCGGARMDWLLVPGGWEVRGVDCTGPRPGALAAPVALMGPGARMAPGGEAFGGRPLWLLWADADYRMAALGTPGGEWGMIVARPGLGARGDLFGAAREVMDFNGYRTEALRP